MMRTIAIAALMLTAPAAAQAAEVYRWVDEQGRVHYSDRWVPGAELVGYGQPRPPDPEGDAEREAAEKQALTASNERIATQQAEEAAQKAVQQDMAQIRAERCRKAREDYQKAIQARRVYRTGPNGEREYVSEAEADAWRAKRRMEMEQACAQAGG